MKFPSDVYNNTYRHFMFLIISNLVGFTILKKTRFKQIILFVLFSIGCWYVQPTPCVDMVYQLRYATLSNILMNKISKYTLVFFVYLLWLTIYITGPTIHVLNWAFNVVHYGIWKVVQQFNIICYDNDIYSQVGTLDQLVGLSDDLSKIDSFVEA